MADPPGVLDLSPIAGVADLQAVAWVIPLGIVAVLVSGFAMGANDIANAFGASVGARVLTVREACLIAAVFDVLGAMTLGARVSNTIAAKIIDVNVYENEPGEFMLGMLSASLASATMVASATQFGLPVSTTHAVVGAVIGFSFVRSTDGIVWFKGKNGLGAVMLSWVVSPVFAGLVAAAIYIAARRFCFQYARKGGGLTNEALALHRHRVMSAVVLGWVAALVVLLVALHFSVGWWIVFVVLGLWAVVAALGYWVLVPFLLQRRVRLSALLSAMVAEPMSLPPTENLAIASRASSLRSLDSKHARAADVQLWWDGGGEPLPAIEDRDESDRDDDNGNNGDIDGDGAAVSEHESDAGSDRRGGDGNGSGSGGAADRHAKDADIAGAAVAGESNSRAEGGQSQDNRCSDCARCAGGCREGDHSADDGAEAELGRARGGSNASKRSRGSATAGGAAVGEGSADGYASDGDETAVCLVCGRSRHHLGRVYDRFSDELEQRCHMLSVITASFMAFTHGANDIANAAGPLLAIWDTYQAGFVDDKVDTAYWVIVLGCVGVVFGLWMWGSLVIATVGFAITKITATRAFTIQLGTATSVLLASFMAMPVSSSHCFIGAVVCVGVVSGGGKAAIKWKLVRKIFTAWVVTVPLAGLLSAALFAAIEGAVNGVLPPSGYRLAFVRVNGTQA